MRRIEREARALRNDMIIRTRKMVPAFRAGPWGSLSRSAKLMWQTFVRMRRQRARVAAVRVLVTRIGDIDKEGKVM